MQAKAEKSLARFKGLESIAKLPQEHKDQLVELANNKLRAIKEAAEKAKSDKRVKKLMDEARELVKAKKNPQKQTKPNDNGMEMWLNLR